MSSTSVFSRLTEGLPPWLRDAVAPEATFTSVDALTERVSSWSELVSRDAPSTLIVGAPEVHPVDASLVPSLSHPLPLPSQLTGDYTAEPLTFARLRDARVDPRWGLVQTKRGAFLEESVHSTRWFDPRLSGLPDEPISGAGRLRYVRARGAVDVMRPTWGARTLRGRHLLLGHWAAHNYGHFLMDCLPAVLHLGEHLRSGSLKLLTRPTTAWQREILRLLAVPNGSIVEVEDALVHVSELVFPLALTCCYMVHPASVHRAIFDALRCAPRDDAATLLYVSRATRAGSRTMIQERALVDALVTRGFRVVDPATQTIAEQAATFSRAQVIVGPMGAGLANIGLAPPGCAVVQIMPGDLIEAWTARLCAVLGHRYVGIVAPVVRARPTVVAERVRTDMELDFEAPVAVILRAVDSLTTSA